MVFRWTRIRKAIRELIVDFDHADERCVELMLSHLAKDATPEMKEEARARAEAEVRAVRARIDRRN